MAGDAFSVRERRVVVVGAARSGVAAAELLAKRGALVTLTEARDGFDSADRLRACGVRLELGGHRPETLAGADLVVVSPGVPVEQSVFEAARERGVEIIGELELASRWIRGRVIAVTGTKGKSTTTTLIGRMLDAAGQRVLVGGNIGVPLCAQVDASTVDTLHVVEASSFQLETTTTFRPWIGVWLNVADDHLDRHPSFDAYVSAKARIFANQTADDWALVNADDSVVTARTAGVVSRRVPFALSGRIAAGFVVDDEWIVKRTAAGAERLVPVAAVELDAGAAAGLGAGAARDRSVALTHSRSHGRRQETHDAGRRFQRLVQRSGPAGRARGLLARARQHGDSSEWLWHLGAHAAHPR